SGSGGLGTNRRRPVRASRAIVGGFGGLKPQPHVVSRQFDGAPVGLNRQSVKVWRRRRVIWLIENRLARVFLQGEQIQLPQPLPALVRAIAVDQQQDRLVIEFLAKQPPVRHLALPQEFSPLAIER